MERLTGFLRRQLWVADGTEADRRFLAALAPLLVRHADGTVGLVTQRPTGLGVVSWVPDGPARSGR
jgi:hypothetical protein